MILYKQDWKNASSALSFWKDSYGYAVVGDCNDSGNVTKQECLEGG